MLILEYFADKHPELVNKINNFKVDINSTENEKKLGILIDKLKSTEFQSEDDIELVFYIMNMMNGLYFQSGYPEYLK
jgi:hypothetical protein